MGLHDLPYLVIDRIMSHTRDHGLIMLNIMLTSSHVTRQRCLNDNLTETVAKRYSDHRAFLTSAAIHGYTEVIYSATFKITTLLWRVVLDTALRNGHVHLARRAQDESAATLRIGQIISYFRHREQLALTTMNQISLPFCINDFVRFLHQKSHRGTWECVHTLLKTLDPTAHFYDFKLGAALIYGCLDFVNLLLSNGYPVSEAERLMMTQVTEPWPAPFWDVWGFPDVSPDILVRSQCTSATIAYISRQTPELLVNIAEIAISKSSTTTFVYLMDHAHPHLHHHRASLFKLALSDNNSDILRIMHRYGFELGVTFHLTYDKVRGYHPQYLELLISMGGLVDDPHRLLWHVCDMVEKQRSDWDAKILMAYRRRHDYSIVLQTMLTVCMSTNHRYKNFLWNVVSKPLL